MNDHPNIYHDVRDFHRKMGLANPRYPRNSSWDDAALIEARKELIRREFQELVDGLDRKDPANVAHEVADVVFSAVGVAVAFGLPFDEAWRAVFEANMAKESVAATPGSGGRRIIKPKGWTAPSDTIKRAVRGWVAPLWRPDTTADLIVQFVLTSLAGGLGAVLAMWALGRL